MIATLGTNIADPVARLEAISASTRRAKEHLQSLPKSAIESYTLLLMGPYILQLVSGLGGRTRPVFNITISNVPGPQQTLYLRGARMVANYPVSLVTHGQAINITCHGYADTLNFGFIGCRDTLPHMQRIAVYTGEALEELEAAIYKGRGK
jgi:diacylglycerol O-acyltransferase